MTKQQKQIALNKIEAAIVAGDMTALAAEIGRAYYDSEAMRAGWQKLYERYRGAAPIKDRVYEIDGQQIRGKINRKIPHDFFGEIIDDKVGFMVGHPVKYVYGDGENKAAAERLKEFGDYAVIQDHDAEAIRMAAICGVAYRLIYHKETTIFVSEVDPWAVVYLWDRERVAALVIYDTSNGKNVDCYSGGKRYEFALAPASDATIYDTTMDPPAPVDQAAKRDLVAAFTAVADTGLVGVPVIEFINNNERQGDCSKVLDLIDQYDRLTSDTLSEMEQFRLAYFALFGARLPETPGEQEIMLAKMRQTGLMEFPPTSENPSGGTGAFIQKVIDVGGIKVMLDMIEDKIYRFSKSINYGRDALVGMPVAGVALKQRLQQIRHKCLTTWGKAQTALREQWRIIGGMWTASNVPFDYLKVQSIMTLDIPVDMQEEAGLLGALDGKVSRRTALGLVSFIDDVDAELKRMEAEGIGVDLNPTDKDKKAAAAEIEAERKGRDPEKPDQADTTGGAAPATSGDE